MDRFEKHEPQLPKVFSKNIEQTLHHFVVDKWLLNPDMHDASPGWWHKNIKVLADEEPETKKQFIKVAAFIHAVGTLELHQGEGTQLILKLTNVERQNGHSIVVPKASPALLHRALGEMWDYAIKEKIIPPHDENGDQPHRPNGANAEMARQSSRKQ